MGTSNKDRETLMQEYKKWWKSNWGDSPVEPMKKIRECLTKEEREKYWTPKHYLNNKAQVLAENQAYNEKHKEERSEQRKQHYTENRERLLDSKKTWGGVKIVCEGCGATIRRDGKADHIKTMKHQKVLNVK